MRGPAPTGGHMTTHLNNHVVSDGESDSFSEVSGKLPSRHSDHGIVGDIGTHSMWPQLDQLGPLRISDFGLPVETDVQPCRCMMIGTLTYSQVALGAHRDLTFTSSVAILGCHAANSAINHQRALNRAFKYLRSMSKRL